MAETKATTTAQANKAFEVVTEQRAPPSALAAGKSHRSKTVTFRDKPVQAEEDKLEKLRGTSNRYLTSSHDLFFDSPDWHLSDSNTNLFCHHFTLHWTSFFSLMIEIFLIVLRLVWKVLLLVFNFLWLIVTSVGQILLCILLGVYFVLTACCPGSGIVFGKIEHLQDMKAIRWKNIQKLFLFLRVEPLIHSNGHHAALSDGISKFATSSDLIKSIPTRNLNRLILEVI